MLEIKLSEMQSASYIYIYIYTPAGIQLGHYALQNVYLIVSQQIFYYINEHAE